MEDDEPIAEMPTFICSFEDGRSKVSRSRLPAETSTGESKVERPLRDCSRVTGSTSSLSLDEDKGDTKERSSEDEAEEDEEEKGKDSGEVAEKDAKGNNNNNCNGGGGEWRRRKRRRASAVDILRRNLGVARSTSLRSNANTWTSRDTERNADDDENEEEDAASSETGEAGIEIKRTECDSETSDGDAGQFVNLTGNGREAAPNTKDHVYCTVYCIANELGGAGVTDDGTDDAGSQMVSEAPPEAGSSPEPSLYTLDDLVDPFGDIARHVSFGQADADADAAVQSCWVCLEGKSIAPLPCCKKTVCDECLKIYVTTQVGERGTGVV